MTSDLNATNVACRQCATCCRKGGPALHLEDQALITQGVITFADLVTLRRGEPVYDNVRQALALNKADIIKIKGGREGAWDCRFLVGQKCGIYSHRPLECRLLACRVPAALAAVYDVDRLDRMVLLARVAWLVEIVQDHQARCDYAPYLIIRDGAVQCKPNGLDEGQLSQSVAYDHHLRAVIQEKGAIPETWLDFLLGRPMRRVLDQVR